MAIANGFIQTLRRYGARSDKNKLQLEIWLDEAIEEVAANNGGHIVSGSANGSSFSQLAYMTNAEWAACLDQALYMIDSGIKNISRSYGQF